MQLLKWSAELELGLEHIDNQHKQMINMINEVNVCITYGQPNSVILPIVERLQNYAISHFKAEADIFSKYCYPDRAEHETEHASFIDSLKYIHRQCEVLDSPMSNKIRDFLLDWLVNHIKTKDVEYKRFIDKVLQKTSNESNDYEQDKNSPIYYLETPDRNSKFKSHMEEIHMLSPVSASTPLNSTTNVGLAVKAETKAPQVAKIDQVDVSVLAQKLATDGDTRAQEVQESGAEKASETRIGKA